jgi:hypothetical protein
MTASQRASKTVSERMLRGKPLLAGLSLAAVLPALPAFTQIVGAGAQDGSGPKTQAVSFLYPEQVTIHAGKPEQVELHFRVGPGLHINSHTPSDEFYIATSFTLANSDGVTLAGTGYPPGESMSLASDPSTKLSVYTGEFVIQAQFVSEVGNHLAQGKLHYQACDRNQCMPPKTISVPIDVIAK